MKKFRKILGFSLVELLISLIAISCITAAFAPVISKRLTSGALSIGAGEVKVTSGNFLPIPECHEKYGSLCNLCGPEGCYGCSKTCQDGEYINVSKCTCANCEDSTNGYGANCIKCDGEKCFQCSNGYYLVNQSKKCKICPEGYYCNDGKVATKCPQGYQCPTEGLSDPIGCEEQTYQVNEGATSCNACESNQYSPVRQASCTNCSATYNQGCTTCTTSGCTGVQSGYYLKDNKAYPLSSIQNCAAVNSTGCTLCNSGYYLKDKHTCNLCNTISGCSTCSHSALSCTSCSIGYYQSNSSTCNLCSNAMTNCSTCSSGTSCTKCDSSAYYLYNHTCHACTSLSGCTLCNSSLSGCQACNTLHTLQADNYCKLNCPTWCAQCSSGNNNCSVCPTGSTMNAENSCVATATAIPNCATASHTTLACATCNSGYYLLDGVCHVCSLIAGCSVCSQSTAGCCTCNSSFVVSRGLCWAPERYLSMFIASSTGLRNCRFSRCSNCVNDCVSSFNGCVHYLRCDCENNFFTRWHVSFSQNNYPLVCKTAISLIR